MLEIEWLSIPIFDSKDFLVLFIRFLLNFVVSMIVIKGIYYRVNKRSEYLFTFIIFNILIFFVSSLLSDAKMKTGFAFGLFAVFSILRYRTEQIEIKEMTFLFISIILAVINSVVTDKISLINILFADIVIVIASYILEIAWLENYRSSIPIKYENIELIQEGHEEELINDLRKRTGLPITSVEIKSVSFMSDSANLIGFYDNRFKPKK